MKMLTCKEASRLISEGQERPLGRLERWGLHFHLWICSSCRRFQRQVRFLRRALKLLGRRLEAGTLGPDPSPELSSEARTRIRRALLDQG